MVEKKPIAVRAVKEVLIRRAMQKAREGETGKSTATDDVADDDHVDEHDDVCASEVMRTTSSTCSPG